MEITDTKEFFNAAKKSSRMIVHFYRSVTPRCQIVDAHFERLAPTHLETRFVKIDAEKSPYLVEKLGIILMPTIVLIKEGKTEHSIHGFDEFGGTDDFTTSDMAYVLAAHKVLNFEADRSEEINQRAARAGLNSVRLATIRAGEYDHASDDELFNDD
jgi:thioredoxin-like negative regulator of GroEL